MAQLRHAGMVARMLSIELGLSAGCHAFRGVMPRAC